MKILCGDPISGLRPTELRETAVPADTKGVASGNSHAAGRRESASADRDSSTNVWQVPLAVALGGLLVTAWLAWAAWNRAEAEAEATLAHEGERLARSIEDAVHEGTERLAAVAGFFQARGEVSQSEFLTFTKSLDPVPGMGGLGYMPIVTAEELDDHQERVSESIPGYFVFELDDEGNRIPVEPSGLHVPVQWFEPREAFGRPHGFDSASDLVRRSALTRARWTKEASVTSFLTLVSEGDADGFLIYWPVVDPVTSETTGFAVAPMDLSELLDGQIPRELSDEVEWEIDTLMDGRRPKELEAGSWRTVIDVGSNSWSVTVMRAEGASIQPSVSERPIVPILVAGLITSLLAAAVFHQYRTKRRTEHELNRLRELTRAKDQFLASVSHELRTPLTGVLGFAELLRSDHAELTNEERHAMIASVAGEASDLAAIIDDLLVAARSELDLLAITQVPVSLRAQLAQVVEAADSSVRDCVEIVGETTRPAMGDPGRVRQIIRNLLTNATRYGGGQIEIRFSATDDLVHVDVADNGPGVPDDESQRIFEPYHRVHQSNGTQPAALGIGLSVARHLARLMDGDVVYRRQGGWSVFRLSLPIAPADVRPEQELSVSINL